MKTNALLHRLFLLLLLLVTPALPLQAAEVALTPDPPQLAARAWVLMDAATGRVLVEQNADQRLPPASLTKLMTAYIATLEVQQGKLRESDQVRVSEHAWKSEGSRMFLEMGKPVTVDNLMHGIIIQSGNDASVALAEHIAGTEDAFAERMNATAQRLGMKNSHFMNATGLPNPQHFSSAHDMALLGRAIIHDDPTHYAIYSQREFEWNGIKQQNRNLLLRDPTVDGLKTGHTDEAGYCLVASAVRNGMRLIGVVFGTANEKARAAELEKLLSYGFRFYESRTFYQKGAGLAQAPVWKGGERQVALGLADDLTIVLPRGQTSKLEATMVILPQIMAPVAAGQELGRVEVRLGKELLHTAPLIALQTVEEGGFFRRLWDSIRLFLYGIFN